MTPSSTQMYNKRVRVDNTVTIIPETSNTTSVARLKVPKARASAAIATHTATLLPRLSTILQNLGETHLGLLHRFYTKSNQLRQMKPDDMIIPHSARLNFELSVPKSVTELPDFIALQDIIKSDLENPIIWSSLTPHDWISNFQYHIASLIYRTSSLSKIS